MPTTIVNTHMSCGVHVSPTVGRGGGRAAISKHRTNCAQHPTRRGMKIEDTLETVKPHTRVSCSASSTGQVERTCFLVDGHACSTPLLGGWGGGRKRLSPLRYRLPGARYAMIHLKHILG